ncbi:PstS family phosphate ABC transporter substrate-binding protein [Vibrio sp. VB16]|uniref:PstS family phosphate ABC transporter substrate-binding protein n=1 Tax=Vibrio sp. VB16 TaxID=2785746 RepID=UPI00189CEFAE|nr:phosphate ABC transporter substrate-binding protein PstS family protein [Vibrio sp. VB16]UGA55326.1 PstS family phosphate ABC transporter substrate-binding protein [Vibrio sp. VB16]
MRVVTRLSIIRLLFITLSLFSVSPQALAKELPDYNKVSGLSGNLTSVGSDTLASMLSLWGEAFKTYYPNVNVQVQASGSSTASPALTEGTAQFGPMSRPMRLKELEAFEREHGYKPTELKIAIDAIGIFVHKDNPIEGLSFFQIDSIFSSTLRCGSNKPLEYWFELDVKSEWAKRRIQLFGRNSVSGTYGYFKKTALCGGDFKRNVNELPGSASVVQAVASGINTIGYSGVGYSVSNAKRLPISVDGTHYVEATRETILSGEYPLSRFLYVYINKHPGKQLSLIETEFIRFIYSKQGQMVVEKDGYVAISADLANKELENIGL